jgi:hypothetical protein
MPRVMNKNFWPHQVTMKDLGEDPDPREEWMKEKLYHGGHYEPNWYILRGYTKNTYCFKDEKEFLHFLLIWQ